MNKPMSILDSILPEVRFDLVTPDMARPRSLGRFALDGPARYEYLTSRRARCGWFEHPSDEIDVVLDAWFEYHRGRRHAWYILLRPEPAGWRVDKAHPCGSIQTAQALAKIEWAIRAHWTVFLTDAGPILGPKRMA